MQKKLSILILLPIIPFPPNTGGNICSYIFIEHLRGIHNFTVIMPAYHETDNLRIEQLIKKWPNVSIITVKLYNLNVDIFKKSLFVNLKNVLKASVKFSALYNLLRFIYRKFRSKAKNQESSKSKSIFDKPYYVNPFLSVLPEYIDIVNKQLLSTSFDIIQVEYVNNLPIINILPVTIKKLYVEIESRYLILQDYEKIDIKHSKEFKKSLIEQIKSIDTANMSEYDGILALSQSDEKRLQNLLPDQTVYYSPYGLVDEKRVVLEPNKFKMEKLIFIGPEHHYPNKDAVEWFLEEIFPELFEYGIDIHIIGYWPGDFKRKYKSNKRIIFPGFVDDLSSYISNSINIVPIRIGGGGLRAKNLVSLSGGIPMVSTRLGSDGVALTDGENVLFAENQKEFINQIKYLLENKSEAYRIACNSIEFYNQNHSIEIVTKLRNNIYNKVAANGQE